MSIVSNGSHHSSAVYQYPYITSSIPNASAINPGQILSSTPQQIQPASSMQSGSASNSTATAIVVPSTLLSNNPLLNNVNSTNSIKSPINTMPATLPSLSAVNSGSMGSHYTPTAIKSTSAISSPVGPSKLTTTYSNNSQNTGKCITY